MKIQVTLCLDCAEKLKQGFKVTKIKSFTEKTTCAECGKKRFCDLYEVAK